MGKREERLKELGIELPAAPTPMGAYLPWARAGSLLFVSGQLPRMGGTIAHKGRVPTDISVEAAREAARVAALNAVSVIKSAVEDLDKVRSIVRMTCWVASADTFFDQPQIADGASELLVTVFGEAGRHSRMTTGVNVLPGNAAVGVDLVVALE